MLFCRALCNVQDTEQGCRACGSLHVQVVCTYASWQRAHAGLSGSQAQKLLAKEDLLWEGTWICANGLMPTTLTPSTEVAWYLFPLSADLLPCNLVMLTKSRFHHDYLWTHMFYLRFLPVLTASLSINYSRSYPYSGIWITVTLSF